MIENFINSIGAFLATGGIKLLTSVVLLVVCWKLIGLLIKFLKKNRQFNKIDEGARGFLLSCISIILKVVLVLTVAANLGVPMTNIVAILGSCGLAIGLALQGSLANFAGGLMILVFHPFRVGDYIEASGKEGTVKSISLLYTTVTTIDNKDVIMPNGALTNAVITNFSAEDTRRVDLEFAVAYDSDAERVKQVLLLLADKHELVLKDPAPFARMTKHDQSALIFSLRVWSKKDDYWTVKFDLLEQVKTAFDKLEIQIPFPQMDVHIHE
ncbi:MAG: mechanosensitive ion channel family protein [Clostridia bacterium]|nr:mechanosensitive ion channel family protein [Clostridia bacterium]